MKRFLVALGFLTLAGCEQARPPSAAVMAARTALGTRNTKIETRTQPSPPGTGRSSIWDFKVFDIHDNPDKTRKEWKFFKDLPQSPGYKATTEVFMNAWLISKDRNVFLPQKPVYRQYGSFLTDWTIPTAGDYTLWIEYQPVIAKDELSFADLKKAPALAVEHGRWDFTATGDAQTKAPALAPDSNAGEGWTAYLLDASNYGTKAPFKVFVPLTTLKAKQQTTLNFEVKSASGSVSEQTLTVLSPDSHNLVHVVGAAPSVRFSQKGLWRAWFSFEVDDKPYAAPVDLKVE